MPSPKDAAPWMWALAALLLLGGSCMGLSGLMLWLIDTPFMQQVVSEMPPDQAAAIRNEDPLVGAALVAFSAFGLILALIVAGLAFGVRAGGHGSIRVARVLMVALLVGLGAVTLLTLIGGLAQGQPVQLVMSLLMIGAPTALAAVAAARLFGGDGGTSGGGSGGGIAPDEDEPWNAHLRGR